MILINVALIASEVGFKVIALCPDCCRESVARMVMKRGRRSLSSEGRWGC